MKLDVFVYVQLCFIQMILSGGFISTFRFEIHLDAKTAENASIKRQERGGNSDQREQWTQMLNNEINNNNNKNQEQKYQTM